MRCDFRTLINEIEMFGISTHAPRVRCDIKLLPKCKPEDMISTHAPRVRCDGLIDL